MRKRSRKRLTHLTNTRREFSTPPYSSILTRFFKMPDWAKINADKRQDILWGQSWNLAATMMAPLTEKLLGEPTALKKTLEAWQNYFFTKLNERYVVEEPPFDPDVY
jgi:hypothetical protein